MNKLKLRDVNPVNAATHAVLADFEARRFEYLVARRDQLLDKVRFGALVLNGASLLAVISNVGAIQAGASWLGFTQNIARDSAAAFTLGVTFAGISALIDANISRKEAADAFVRQSRAKMLAARYEDEADDPARVTLKRQMDEYHAAPGVDFQYSRSAIWLQSIACGCWLAGVLFPLLGVLHF